MGENEITPLQIAVSSRITLDDGDIARLRVSSEDHFVERKSFGDWKKDCVKTVVAFANSAPIGRPAFLFIGVKDDGAIEANNQNLDSIQKTLADQLRSIYPPVYYVANAMTEADGSYLVVIVYGSEERPHFAGHSYIREGSQTVAASEEQFRRLIAQRQSKSRALLDWKDKAVTVERVEPRSTGGPSRSSSTATIVDCNQFYVTLSNEGKRYSYALSEIEVNFDHVANRLKVERHSG